MWVAKGLPVAQKITVGKEVEQRSEDHCVHGSYSWNWCDIKVWQRQYMSRMHDIAIGLEVMQ